MSNWPSIGDLKRGFDALPVVGLDVVAPDRALVLVPHPDDESLGCGGLISALAEAGRPPLLVLLTDGSRSHPNSASYPRARLAAVRKAEFYAAARILGVPAERVVCIRLPDGDAPHEGTAFDGAVQRVVTLIRAHHVRTVFATWIQDPHGDHVSAARIAAAACACTGARHLAYPIWFRMADDAAPAPVSGVDGVRLDIARFLDKKRAAIAAHETQNGLIADDPDGFSIPADMLDVFTQSTEVYLTAPL